MAAKIHPTASVHPTAVLDGDVEVGEGCVIGALTYILGPARIGAHTKIYPHCVIGCEGEHKTKGPVGAIVIGERNMIRELVVIQRGTGDHETTIGNDCYVMDHTHVAHDVVLDDEVTLSPNVVLGGHSHVLRAATIGIGAVTHQFSTVGAYSMTGMGAVVTKDVPPFAVVVGNPAKFLRLNTHGVKRAGVAEDAVKVEGGVLVSDHETVRSLSETFKKHVRRQILDLVPSRE